VSQYLTEDGSELQHSDEHTATLFEPGDCLSLQRGFCRAVHRDSVSAQHSHKLSDVHWQEGLLLHAFQTPSTLCHVYFVDLKITTAVTLNGCRAPTD